MEWMLQVVDELDDALHAARHHLYGNNAEIGMILGRLRPSRRVRR
jgi:hypothetical protein